LCSILSVKLIKKNFSFIFIPIEIYIHFVLFFCLGKLIRFNLIYIGSFFQLGRAFKKEYLKSAESTYTSFPLVQKERKTSTVAEIEPSSSRSVIYRIPKENMQRGWRTCGVRAIFYFYFLFN
jgi:hypothetical protein